MSYSEQVGIIDREVEGFMKSSRSRGGQREERSVIKQGSEWSEDKDGGAGRNKRKMGRKPDFRSRERVAARGETKGGGRLLRGGRDE